MKKVDLQVDPSLLKELVVGDKIFRSAFDCNVTERDLQKARKELNETEEKRTTCLKELKTMLSKDKRMKYRMDDDYLLRFLRFRKFDVERTYKFTQRFYILRNEDPLLFTLPLDAECKFKGKFANLLPYTNDNGEMVFLHRVGYWNHLEVSVRDFCVLFSYASDVITMNPHAQIDGVIAIFDLKGISAGQLSTLLHPPALKFWLKFFQEVYPWRIKKMIFFHCNAMILACSYLVRSIMKKKIWDRVVLIRSDLEELHKHVNPEILPKEYGGNLDDEECCSYVKKLVLSNKDYIRYENSFIGYNE